MRKKLANEIAGVKTRLLTEVSLGFRPSVLPYQQQSDRDVINAISSAAEVSHRWQKEILHSDAAKLLD